MQDIVRATKVCHAILLRLYWYTCAFPSLRIHLTMGALPQRPYPHHTPTTAVSPYAPLGFRLDVLVPRPDHLCVQPVETLNY
jgi:hypothetical protein